MIFTALILSAVVFTNMETPHKNLVLECDKCHAVTEWKEIVFDHSTTEFVLWGRHAGLGCRDCHNIEDFGLARADCSACHLDTHQGKLGPDCGRCHNPQGWSIFNTSAVHANTTFPLMGAHARLDCKACHISEIEGEYSFLKSECVSCHYAEFQAAANPSHTDMGFGTRCEECHFPVSWYPANFVKHDAFFPISSGAHAGVWSSCNDCHSNPNDRTVFSCLGCHEHNQNSMNDHHSEVNGYAYDSNACYSCHPRGQGGD
jgi:hypothetical protein